MPVKTTVMGRSKEEKLTGATCGSGMGLTRMVAMTKMARVPWVDGMGRATSLDSDP
jgi:hypothetical protein